jgi:hypothetical protein
VSNAVNAIKELEEAAMPFLLLHGKSIRPLNGAQMHELVEIFGFNELRQ